ncbi:MAG: thioesterase [Proteobacteria bacterium]|nr:MAG: thioesterase [Pseudomonadota bacterium]
MAARRLFLLMNLYGRLLYTIFISWWQGRGEIAEAQVLHFRAWPHDLDINLHVNNGRYLTLMDLGRVQLMARLGMGRKILAERWMPVIGSVHMRYRRSLPPFRAFRLETRILAWDEKWFFIEQKFMAGEELMAVGLVKGLFRGGQGSVPVAELLSLSGEPEAVSGPIPEVFLSVRSPRP